MSDNQLEQELRERVEQEITKRLDLEKRQLQEYQNTLDIDLSVLYQINVIYLFPTVGAVS